jgi:DNA repair exonuclease SbcCD ATPase subunit
VGSSACEGVQAEVPGVTTPLSEPMPTSGRTIGEILLARGFVTQAKLADAMDRQRESGKPLGQILVEENAISRLELASALAEQWSDIGSVSPDFGTGLSAANLPSGNAEGTLVEIEELRRTRLALEERMLAFERSGDAPQAETDLIQRVEALESALAQLPSLDGRDVDDLHEAVAQLDRRVAASEPQLVALVDRLDEMHASLFEAQGRVSDVSERLSELGAAVEKAFVELERRSVEAADAVSVLAGDVEAGPVAALAALTERLEGIEHRLFGLAAAESVAELAERVDALSVGTEGIETANRLDDLAHQVKDLQGRPAGDPQLLARLDDLADGVRELERRVDGGRAGESHLAAQLQELADRVDALASRPVADGESDARVAELAVRFERLAASLEELNERDTSRADLEARFDALAGRLEELAARPGADDELTARVDALVSRLDAVAGAQDEVARASLVEELRARVDEVVGRSERGEALAERVEAVAARVEDLARDESLAERVAEIAERDDSLAERVEALAARVEELGVRPVPDGRGEERLDDLAARLVELEAVSGELRDAVATATTGAPADDGVVERLAALDRVAASLGRELAGLADAVTSERAALDARFDALATRLEQVESAPAPPTPVAAPPPRVAGIAASDDDVERLRMAVERLALDFAEHRRAVTAAMSSREVGGLLEELAARVDELQEAAVSGGVPAGGGGDGGDGGAGGVSSKELRALTRRLDELEESTRTSRDGVLDRLERMMGTIDWRLQRLEHPAE